MSSLLSIIIANYNHKIFLPRLLDSIIKQKIPKYEVIIVDDCSNERCMDIVEAYLNKGMNIQLIEHEMRKYTKNARLTGIISAKGDIIAFADADDVILGTDALASNIDLMIRTNADILHFPSAELDKEANFKNEWEWARPYATSLTGIKIFETYVTQLNMQGHALIDKLYLKKLWLEILPEAENSSIRHWREDFFLVSLYLFHSRRYIGSEYMGYGYCREKPAWTEMPETAEAICTLLREFIPYLQKNNCSQIIIDQVILCYLNILYQNVKKMCEHAHWDKTDAIFCNLLEQYTKNIDLTTLSKILLIAYNQAMVFYSTKSQMCKNYEIEISDLKNEIINLKNLSTQILNE